MIELFCSRAVCANFINKTTARIKKVSRIKTKLYLYTILFILFLGAFISKLNDHGMTIGDLSSWSYIYAFYFDSQLYNWAIRLIWKGSLNVYVWLCKKCKEKVWYVRWGRKKKNKSRRVRDRVNKLLHLLLLNCKFIGSKTMTRLYFIRILERERSAFISPLSLSKYCITAWEREKKIRLTN